MPPGIYPRPSYADAFWAKVDKSGDCWLWTRCKTNDGYGQYRWKRAHRVAWELTHGPIPEGLQVLHHCDVPLCVRPDHLFIGTHQENMADRDRKGRTLRGERAGYAKISDADAELARRMYKDLGGKWGSVRIISKALGIGYANTSLIVRGKSRVT